MARLYFTVALACGVFANGSAIASGQDIAPAPAPPVASAPISAPAVAVAPAAPAQGPCCTIPAGTVVLVELTEPLSAATAVSGAHFGLRLAEPVSLGGSVVLPAGIAGMGEVIDAKPAGFGGRPARLVLAARYLESDGVRFPLRSLKLGGGGIDNSGGAVVLTMAVGILGAAIHGGGVEYAAGTRAIAKLAADVTSRPITILPATAAPSAPALPTPSVVPTLTKP